MEFIRKIFASIVSTLKGLIGLVRKEENRPTVKKVAVLLAAALLAVCISNTAAAILDAKKNGRWH